MDQKTVAAPVVPVADGLFQGLICPVCGSATLLYSEPGQICCHRCGQVYPVIAGIPVLIDEQRSVFRYDDFVQQRSLFFDLSRYGALKRRLAALVPNLDKNTISQGNYARLTQLLAQCPGRARVLVLGGAFPGQGMTPLLSTEHIDLVESDVSFGPRTQIILDAHTIPYAAASFDAVIAQAVLEHVLDPVQCVAEIHRVLRDDGLVYVETPFMQQVHGGQYDFTRFSHSGHRRLLRHFTEIDSGMTGGPGTALAWSYQYLLLSLFGYSERARAWIKAFARLTGFWLRYLDPLARRNPRAIDAAAGVYFLGRKAVAPLSDHAIVAYYQQQAGH